MGIDILHVGVDGDALQVELAIEIGIDRRVERNEVVGHNASAAIDGAALAKSLELQRVGKVDAVNVHHLATLETVHQVFFILALLAFLIGFLYATA